MNKVDWARPIIIQSTDWQEELPASGFRHPVFGVRLTTPRNMELAKAYLHSMTTGVANIRRKPMLSDRIAASRECDAEIARAIGWGCVMSDPVCDDLWVCWRKEYRSGEWIMLKPYTTSLDAASSLYLTLPDRIPSDPMECCAEALKQRGL